MHLKHRWSKWVAREHYLDHSWGGEAVSTMMSRRCLKCGHVQTKTAYGVEIPIEPW